MAAKYREVDGLEELQAYNQRVIAGLRGPYLNTAVRDTTLAAQRYAISITHEDTGALRASHRVELVSARQEGIISLDTSARNPRSNALTSEYGVYEHDRGGDHAFYKRTIDERGEWAGNLGLDVLVESVRNGR
ncbi:MAG: hypothetical protein JXB07_18895 [Anaerolineae bacterium]|nr:hypothetical protein [Anaerolineae bacterium]